MKSFIVFFAALIFAVGCASNSAKTDSKDAKACEAGAKAVAQETNKSVKKEGGAHAGAVTCTKGKDVRVLKTEVVSPKGCKTTYTVNGNDKVIASAANETNYCQSKVEKVKANLSAVGYKCE